MRPNAHHLNRPKRTVAGIIVRHGGGRGRECRTKRRLKTPVKAYRGRHHRQARGRSLSGMPDQKKTFWHLVVHLPPWRRNGSETVATEFLLFIMGWSAGIFRQVSNQRP